ncbi:MAG: hypothetical protein ACJAUV_000038 [Flavobacteriales bacterium]|jgi:hypothetical protein
MNIKNLISTKRIALNIKYSLLLGMLLVVAGYLGLNYEIGVFKKLLIIVLLILAVINGRSHFFTKISTNLFLVVFSITLCFVVVDSILRVTYSLKLYYRPQEMFGNRMPEYPMLSRYDKNIDYEGNTYGDLAAMSGIVEYKEERNIRFQTDEKGFRNSKNQQNKNNQIIVTGDSFGVGTGTHQDSTLVGYLSKDFEVYNISQPGNPVQELANLVLEFEAVTHVEKPIVLWLLFSGNDLPNDIRPMDSLCVDWMKKGELKQHKSGMLRMLTTKVSTYFARSPIKQLLGRISTTQENGHTDYVRLRDLPNGQRVYFFQRYVESAQLTETQIKKQAGYQTLKKTFSVARAFAEEIGVTFKVVLIPTKYEVYSWLYDGTPAWSDSLELSGFSKTLTDIFNDLGMDFKDSKPFMVDYAKKYYQEQNKLLYWRDDTHFNSEGHKALSEFVKVNLKE